MSVKFSADVVPLTDLKVNPGRVVKHTAEASPPDSVLSKPYGT